LKLYNLFIQIGKHIIFVEVYFISYNNAFSISDCYNYYRALLLQ